MDLWYEMAIREEMADLNEEVSEMLREAEEASLVAEALLPPADDPDEERE
jgi:hypothetical protein